ncbi:MAG: 5-(carboxyamino)imidazole ribonucleotide synthase [Hyphomicrobiaceae bacterium]
MTTPKRLPPGATIGILGGGQLGRMLAMAGARLGLKSRIYSDVADAPAADVAASLTIGAYTDAEALARFAAEVDVVTYEFENVPVAAADAVAPIVPVYPPRAALAATQDRLIEKRTLSGLGIPVAPHKAVDTAADLTEAMRELGLPLLLKTRRFGYDGKGQVRVEPGADAVAALAALGGVASIAEGMVRFDREISVLAVRGQDGEMRFYDCPENRHSDGILRTSTVPAAISPAVTRQALTHARTLAEALDYVGLLAIELFHIDGPDGGTLIANEVAPRVHNSGHWTIDACLCSQFENHMRAVAGWPLGPTARHSDCVMENLIGHDVEAWETLAADPAVGVHLYGKKDARPGRKMGHINRLKRRQ